MWWYGALWALLSVACTAAEQRPFLLPETHTIDAPLRGRFLHITDIHLDEFYESDSAVVSSCHHNKPSYKHGGEWRAGHYGTSISDCDSPLVLANKTLDWITRSWNQTDSKDTQSLSTSKPFDFILWTGDSARHDQDPLLPRTETQTLRANRYAARWMKEYFPGIPIVPNIGNNDIAMHNIMDRGPSTTLNEMLEIWRDHIPDDQSKHFRRGGFFAKDLIPDRLGVLSINTLYFFDSNKAVDGCPKRHRSDSNKKTDIGTLQLEWMTKELLRFRRRNMQVHIIGHVPPTAGNYFPRCFDVYTEMVLRFQDTIVGQHFGHMNLDIFFVQESSMATRKSSMESSHNEHVPIVLKQVEEQLRLDYESLPGRARTNMDYYSTFHVSPSVIPTYLPSVRVWTYNTTPEHDNRPGLLSTSHEDATALLDYVLYDSCEQNSTDADCLLEAPTMLESKSNPVQASKRKRDHSRPHRRSKSRHRKLPRYASPLAPSRTNTYLSLLGYSQWVLDLSKANSQYQELLRTKGHHAAAELQLDYDLEYATYPGNTLWHEYFHSDQARSSPSSGHHHVLPSDHHIPVPRALLDRKLAQLQLDSPLKCHSDGCHVRGAVRYLTDYELEDMTLPNLMDLARLLVLSRRKWMHYVHRMYVNSLLNA